MENPTGNEIQAGSSRQKKSFMPTEVQAHYKESAHYVVLLALLWAKHVTTTRELLPYTNTVKFCKACTALSKLILKLSLKQCHLLNFFCSYALNSSSKLVKNKIHWLFTHVFTPFCSLSLIRSAILLQDSSFQSVLLV